MDQKISGTGDPVGIWINTEKACIIPLNAPMQIIRADMDRHTRILKSKLGGLHGSTPARSEKQEQSRLDEEMHRFLTHVKAAIHKTDHVVVFGPAYVKQELGKVLSEDARFRSTKVDLVTADRMTPNQLVAWVKRYFRKETSSRMTRI